MRARRTEIGAAAESAYLADVALATGFDDLLAAARAAEQEFRQAQATSAPLAEQYPLAKRLDAALTEVTQCAYAGMRAEIGPRGYQDRIYQRKAHAKPAVHALRAEAERLLTLRETHRLTGIPPRPAVASLRGTGVSAR